MTVVVGNTIAALVASDALASRGASVDLYLTGTVGGGFRGFSVDGFCLELGARLLEISYGGEESTAPPPSLEEYHPGPSGHRPHIKAVRKFLCELLGSDLIEIDRPQMFLNGAMAPDIYFTVDLSKLRDGLTAQQATDIGDETLRILASNPSPEGIFGTPSQNLWSMSLEEASIANHGATFHQIFIESICRKIQAAGSSEVLAALRRKVWMPIFHTKTLWEAVSGKELGFRPNRPFHTIEGGGIADLITRLLERIESSPHVAVRRLNGLTRISTVNGVTRLEFGNGTHRTVSSRPIIGVSPEQLYLAAGVPYAPERVPIFVCWVAVSDDDIIQLPTATFVVDPRLDTYRVNGGLGPPGSRVISLELSHKVLPDEADSVARQSLEAMRIVRPGSAIRLVHQLRVPAFTAPSATNLEGFRIAHESFNEQSVNADIIGGATAFGADSINEQIVQGLRAAEVAD